MKGLLVALLSILILAGCVGSPWGPSASYTVRVYDPATGNLLKEFEGVSARDFEQIKTNYQDGKFFFEAGAVTRAEDPYAAVTAAVVTKALEQYLNKE